MTQLLAGVSRKTITPPVGIHLMGYGNRLQGNIGVHDDLYVSTVILYDGETYAALLTADHTFIHALLVERIKTKIAASTQIQAKGVFVCCSHTHAGPLGYADDDSAQEARAYIDDLVRLCVEGAVEALRDMQPVTMFAGTDQSQININRREQTNEGVIIGENPEGPVDHDVQTLQLRLVSGRSLATLVNYSCHPVVMGPLNRQVSADWVGAMRSGVEESSEDLCLFFQGTPGDINPRKMRWTEDSWDEVDQQGRDVAAAAIRACQQATALTSGAVRVQQEDVWLRLLPARAFDEVFQALVPGIESLEEYHRKRQEAFPWHVDLENRGDGTYSPIAVGAVGVGEWSLATLGAEPFCETGLAIKADSRAAMTFVSGYSNGCNSYLPVASAYESGGYEVETAPLFYKLPAGFAPESEQNVRDTALQLLRSS